MLTRLTHLEMRYNCAWIVIDLNNVWTFLGLEHEHSRVLQGPKRLRDGRDRVYGQSLDREIGAVVSGHRQHMRAGETEKRKRFQCQDQGNPRGSSKVRFGTHTQTQYFIFWCKYFRNGNHIKTTRIMQLRRNKSVLNHFLYHYYRLVQSNFKKPKTPKLNCSC